MKNIKLIILSCLLLGITSSAFSQGPGRRVHRKKGTLMRKLQKTVWTAGLSGVVIADAGKQFKQLFDINTWSSVWIPSRLSLDGAIGKGFSAEGAFTFSQLQAGKIASADNKIRKVTSNLVAFDASAKYDLNELIGDTKAFSPYLIGGFGYTYRDLPAPLRKNTVTGNFGAGFTIWVYKGFGFNAQSMAKFALNRGHGASNYLQHSIGVVYRFNVITGYKTPGRLGHRYNLFRN